MTNFPTFFISHGAPDIALRNTHASKFMRSLDSILPKAKAILVVSAHWETHEPMVTAHSHPATIHDFGGFPRELYEMRYPAVGDALLAAETVNALTPIFPLAALDFKRGLDHGAWIPLLMGLPKAETPVLQLSIQPHRDANHHYEMGKRLQDLREQGVLILASGSATHNLREVFNGNHQTPPKEVIGFNDWLYDELIEGDVTGLKKWEKEAPFARWNHPREEHFLPLFVALGAANTGKSERIHHSFDYGVLSMDAYRLN